MGILKNGSLIAGQNYVSSDRINIGEVNTTLNLSVNDKLTMSFGGTTWSNDTLGYSAGSFMFIAKI